MHINTINSCAIGDPIALVQFAGIGTSLILDGIIRLQNKKHFYPTDFAQIPLGHKVEFLPSIGRRALALNGLTNCYESLWKSCSALSGTDDALLCGTTLEGFGKSFNRNHSLRKPADRVQALIEIDALTALNFDLAEEELVQIYEILFPVLNMYDRESGFDRKSKFVEAYHYFKKRGW